MSMWNEYREKLQALDNWDSFLLKESGLPGPRGNIELAQVVADEGNLQLFRHYASYTVDQAPVNSPHEFLAFCGVLGLGRFLAEGDTDLLASLRVMPPILAGGFARRWQWLSSGLVMRAWIG